MWKRLDQDGSLKKKSGDAHHIPGAGRPRREPRPIDDRPWSQIEQGKIVPAEAQARAAANHGRIIADANRWISHLDNRLAYERTLLDESGYVPPPKPKTKADLPILNYSGKVSYRNRYSHNDVVECEATPTDARRNSRASTKTTRARSSRLAEPTGCARPCSRATPTALST